VPSPTATVKSLAASVSGNDGSSVVAPSPLMSVTSIVPTAFAT
jgi:hypothetical protein